MATRARRAPWACRSSTSPWHGPWTTPSWPSCCSSCCWCASAVWGGPVAFLAQLLPQPVGHLPDFAHAAPTPAPACSAACWSCSTTSRQSGGAPSAGPASSQARRSARCCRDSRQLPMALLTCPGSCYLLCLQRGRGQRSAAATCCPPAPARPHSSKVGTAACPSCRRRGCLALRCPAFCAQPPALECLACRVRWLPLQARAPT